MLESLFNKVVLERILREYFAVNIAKFLKIPFLKIFKNTSCGYILTLLNQNLFWRCSWAPAHKNRVNVFWEYILLL